MSNVIRFKPKAYKADNDVKPMRAILWPADKTYNVTTDLNEHLDWLSKNKFNADI